MYDLGKKFDRNVHHGLRNQNEMYNLEEEIRSKFTSWSGKLERNVRQSKKLDRNLGHGVRNQNEMYDLE